MNTISIIGCGWLGLPLAIRLKRKGFTVKGSVGSQNKLTELRQSGIEAHQLFIGPDKVEPDDQSVFKTDLVIVCIPPRRIDFIETIFPEQINRLSELIIANKIPRVLFISSTSVYNETNSLVSEQDAVFPEKPSGKALLKAEKILRTNPNFRTSVLRFGGLIGADRNPARFLSRSKKAGSANIPVNLIHREDCIHIIEKIIEMEIWGETFNACCPEHPTRRVFYEKAAKVSNMQVPVFENVQKSYKVVDSGKLIYSLGYRFLFPSPIDYLESEIKIKKDE